MFNRSKLSFQKFMKSCLLRSETLTGVNDNLIFTSFTPVLHIIPVRSQKFWREEKISAK